MKHTSHLLLPIIVMLCVVVSGCASIVDGGDKTVPIWSKPDGAKVSIYNRQNKLVAVATTPTILPLTRGYDYFMAQEYVIVCEKEGYKREQALLQCSVNPWYVGNIIFGGLIGLVIVDPATGAMWSFNAPEIGFEMELKVPSPEQIKATEDYSEQLKKSLTPKPGPTAATVK